MNNLTACIKKELLLLSRDLHGLALLFIMPLTFVVIMSLALQTQLAERAGSRLKVLVLDSDQSSASRNFLASIDSGKGFDFIVPSHVPEPDTLDQTLRQGKYAFSIHIVSGFSTQLLSKPDSNTSSLINIGVAADSNKQTESIFLSSVHAALGLERMRAMLNAFGNDGSVLDNAAKSEVSVHYAYSTTGQNINPSAVQQSVPAWLIFGAFFVVVPLSNTLIRERQQGTLRRLRSTNLGTMTLLLGKLAPYFAINQLQVVLMLAAGCYLVPLLGGEALQLHGSLVLLGIMSASLSLCALGLALLIAVSSTTTEQATLLGGTGNIILAALGGIMIPKFVMPATMQSIANWSPMSWGLEGFLDILLRSGNLQDISPEALKLTTLGLSAILLARLILLRKHDQGG